MTAEAEPRPVEAASRPPVSVIMPAYNEEEAIEDAVGDVRSGVLDLVPGAELVVVNDGSRDRTGAILAGLAQRDERIRAIDQPNAGHGGALLRGLSEARGRYLFLLDSDRQIPLDSFERFWREVRTGADAVFGIRARRHDARIRLLLTRFIRRMVAVLFGVDVRDANVPYKLLKRELWEAAEPHIPAGTLAPSLFVALYARLADYDVREMEVTHLERATGEVSIKRWKLFKFCAVAFRQLLAFRRSVRRGV